MTRGRSARRSGAPAVVLRTLVAAGGAAAACAGLVDATVAAAGRLGLPGAPTVAPTALDDLVALACTAVGAAAALVLGAGCGLLLVAQAARTAGGTASRTARAADRLAARLTPRVLRRALALGVGGLLVAAPATAATDPGRPPALDLGWAVTTSPAAPPSTSPDADAAVGTAVVAASSTPAGVATAPGHAVPVGPAPDSPTPSGSAPGDLTPGDPQAPPAGVPHVVVPGDSLWAIAAADLGTAAEDAAVAAHWPRWYAANADVVGPDPDLLRPGQVLAPPDATATPTSAAAGAAAGPAVTTTTPTEQP